MQIKKHLVIFLSLLITSSIVAENNFLVRPDNQHVILNISKLKQEEKQNAVKRAIFLTSLAAGGSYLAYKFLWSSSTPAVPAPTPVHYTQEDRTLSQETNSLVKTLVNKELKPDNSTPKTTPSEGIFYSSYKWLKGQTGSILQLTAATALFYAIQSGLGPVGKYFTRFDGFVDKWLSSIFHDDTLVWFLESHTKHESTLKELESYVDDKGAFADIWAMYVHQVESIVAFMSIKAETLGAKDAIFGQRAHVIAQTLLEDTTQAALDFEKAFESETAEVIAEKVQQHAKQFTRSLDHFKFIEL